MDVENKGKYEMVEAKLNNLDEEKAKYMQELKGIIATLTRVYATECRTGGGGGRKSKGHQTAFRT